MRNDLRFHRANNLKSLESCYIPSSIGEMVYLTDTNSMVIWDGNSWVAIGTSFDDFDPMKSIQLSNMSLYKSRYLIKNKLYDRDK